MKTLVRVMMKHAKNTAALFLLSTGHNTGQVGAGLLVRRGPNYESDI